MVEIIKYITRQSHKPLILIPVILMILSLLYISVFGLNEGVDLKGGTLVTVELNQPMTQSQVTQLVKDKLGINDVKTSMSDNTATITISGSVDQSQFNELFSSEFKVLSFRSVGALRCSSRTDILCIIICICIHVSNCILCI